MTLIQEKNIKLARNVTYYNWKERLRLIEEKLRNEVDNMYNLIDEPNSPQDVFLSISKETNQVILP